MSWSGRRNRQEDSVRLRGARAVLAHRYAVKYRIGGGAAADVYLAHDVESADAVAIKVYSGFSTQDLGAERFIREARVTARLDHPNILTVLDSGIDAGLLYYVMPFAESGTLADVMAHRKPMSVRRVCKILGQLANALAFAHERGIVHRDIKPENVMLFDGRAMLADFGIAKPMQGGVVLSVGGVPLGTPDFMSPEQVLSRPVDGRTDIYALGALAFEMLVGEPPFPRANTMQTMAAHVSDEPPMLIARRPELPIDLTEAIRKCLMKKPEDRWQSMEDLRRVIGAIEARSARQSSDTWLLPVLHQPASPA